uniref:Uncharacterized protein n=1 Tax=Panagrellus redivivus TaxID=6233 RepID=A0A7E4UZ97_PANRE
MEYRHLGGKSHTMASRNTTYFGVLVGLVIVFSLFYLYNSASNDAIALQREVAAQADHLTKLKNEILDLNVNLEKTRDAENTCIRERKGVETQAEECGTKRDQLEAKIRDLESSLTEKEETIKTLRQDIASKAEALESESVKKLAMGQAGIGQEAIIIKLNDTIELLKKDLALKDDVIHALKKNSPLPEGQSDAFSPASEHQSNSETTLKAEQPEANNVLAVPVKPDAVDHPLPSEVNDDKPAPADNEDKPSVEAPEPAKFNGDGAEEEGDRDAAKPEGIAPAALENDKELNFNGDFAGVREPGMRVKMEEAQAAERNAAGAGGDAVIDAAKEDDRDNDGQ